MRYGGIILCGGKSSRMGRDKATLPFGDELMLQRVVRLLGEVVELSRIVCVAAVGQDLPPLPTDVRIARDRTEGRGPLEGLAVGMLALEGEADVVFATSCDVPLLKPQFVRRIFQLLGDYQIVVPRSAQYHHPLAAVYRTSLYQLVESLLANDQLRPLFLFDQCQTCEVPVDELREVDAELQSLINCNRPEDYQAALESAGLT